MKSRVAAIGLAMMLAALLSIKTTDAFPYQFGIDFYQFWGVPVAHKVLVSKASPYVDPSGYAQALNQMADASDSAKLHHANRFRRSLEPMATPFLYAWFDFA